jgi:elongation factor Ts
MSSGHRVIESYVHNGRIGVLIEFSVETSFTVLVPEFVQMAKDLAMHVAAVNPKAVDDLLLQPFVKEPTVTVGQLLSDMSNGFGEQISILRFVRWDSQSPPSEPPSPPDPPRAAPRLRRA